MSVAVAVVGAGVIGKRMARAISLQADMRLVGVGVRRPTPAALVLHDGGVAVYCTESEPERLVALRAAGIEPSGGFEDLLSQADVVVDCGQRGTGATRLGAYRAAGVRAVFCGGEDPRIVGPLFVAAVNFDELRGADALKAGSCNTTAAARIISVVDRRLGVRAADLTFVRCASDPDKAFKGPVGGMVVTPGPSHHAHDLAALFPHAAVQSTGISVATVHAHVATMVVDLDSTADRDEVLAILADAPRVTLLADDLDVDTAELRARGLAAGRDRGDRYETEVWSASVQVDGRRLRLTTAIHMEAITIPELVDGVRAVSRAAADGAVSGWRTDGALGIAKSPASYERHYGRLAVVGQGAR